MKNKLIKSKLITRRKELLKRFQSFDNKENILEEVFLELKGFNFEDYKTQLEKEVRDNLKNWWINIDKGIIKEEKLFSILFEYDYFYKKNVEAASYGIGKWKNYVLQTEEFDMGYDYDFTTQFYASPGLTLNFFDPLEKLDYLNLPDKFKNIDIEELDGFYELIELFKIYGIIAIHEVFHKMDVNLEFEDLNYRDNFMFIIDEHDSSEVYPILIKERK